jgi:hypothetical protein
MRSSFYEMETHSVYTYRSPKIKVEGNVKQNQEVMKIYHCRKQARTRKEWKWTIGLARTHKDL